MALRELYITPREAEETGERDKAGVIFVPRTFRWTAWIARRGNQLLQCATPSCNVET